MNVESLEDMHIWFVRGQVPEADLSEFILELGFTDEEVADEIKHVHRVRVRQWPDLIDPPGYCMEGSLPGRGSFLVTMYDPKGDFRPFYEDEVAS